MLEAAENLEAALRFGPSPFTPQLYQQAVDYLTLVKGRVGTIDATCDQSDVNVLLDGKPWFTCPGRREQRVLAGEHLIVGMREGFVPDTRRIFITGGAKASRRVTLVTIESAVRYEYSSPRWLPYAVAGVGVVVGASGAAFWVAGRREMDRFDADFAEACSMPRGCDADLDTTDGERLLRAQRDGARLHSQIGVSMIAAGSAIAIGGVVWVLLNRPKRILPELDVPPTRDGVTARISWQF
jgi:hypothetical protein